MSTPDRGPPAADAAAPPGRMRSGRRRGCGGQLTAARPVRDLATDSARSGAEFLLYFARALPVFGARSGAAARHRRRDSRIARQYRDLTWPAPFPHWRWLRRRMAIPDPSIEEIPHHMQPGLARGLHPRRTSREAETWPASRQRPRELRGGLRCGELRAASLGENQSAIVKSLKVASPARKSAPIL